MGEQLKSSVKEAEARLDQLREQYESFKRDTDGLTFDTELTGRSRTIYLEFEENEAALSQAIKAHEQSRAKLQQSTLQIEHMKRWANRMAGSLKMFEDCVRVDKPADLPIYFQQMQRAVDKFIAHIVQQISAGKVQRKNMSQVASKEFHEASRLLADKEFVKINCRVPASLDAGRPCSRQGNVEDDSTEAHLLERERCKLEAKEKESEGKKFQVCPGPHTSCATQSVAAACRQQCSSSMSLSRARPVCQSLSAHRPRRGRPLSATCCG